MTINDLAENAINALLGSEMLLEDRIDDLLKRFGKLIPGSTPEAQRQTLEGWANYDPSRNKKYLPWMLQQLAKKEIRTMDEPTLDHLRDLLSDFEHYITMPQFKEPRDIFQYTYAKLDTAIQSNRGLVSKKDIKRGRENKGGATLVNEVGDLTVYAYQDANALSAEAWRGYHKDNPNWDGPPAQPTDPKYRGVTEPYGLDHLWCIRNPHHAGNYINRAPSKAFYMIEKKGWPYIGMVLGDYGNQIVDLHNRQISTGMVEEIYELIKPILDEYAKKKWGVGSSVSSLFTKLRIVRGELQPGETISGADLSGSSLKSLPANLTVSGDLNVSNTKLTELPPGLTVKGSLVIANTAISMLPSGLTVSGNMDLSGSSITVLPPGMNIGRLNISNTNIRELPTGLVVKEELNIANTPITKIPDDLAAEKVVYTPADAETGQPGLSDLEIRRYFFHRREKDVKANFLISPKVEGMNDAQKEAAWTMFRPKLMSYFSRADVIANASAAMFEKAKVPRRK